jgi:hypothetical protein
MTADKVQRMTTLDPHVLIDALAVIMAYEEKELCKPGKVAMFLILDTATNVLGSKERVNCLFVKSSFGLGLKIRLGLC